MSMFAPIEWLIAWRYLRARRSEGGVSAISMIALSGIALGVAAMIITFAVREGFRVERVRTILGNEAHAVVAPVEPAVMDGVSIWGIDNYDEYATSIGEIDGVVSSTPMIARQAMIYTNYNVSFTEVRGVSPEVMQNNTQLVDNGRSYGDIGKFNEGEFVIAIGSVLANQLNAGIGDKITLTTPNAVDTAMGSFPRESAFEVVFIVDSGNNFVDQARVYLPFDMAQSFYDLEGVASRIELRVEDPENVESVRSEVESKVDGRGFMSDWKQQNASFFRGLKVEDNMMFILMTVLVFVSSFTIAAGLIMLVKNKTNDIAIMRTMGFTRGRVMRIFFLAGVILSIAGNVIGAILAALFCFYFDPIFLFIDKMLGGVGDVTALQVIAQLDAVWSWPMVLKVCALSLGISIIITILPARAAAKLDPAEALRHG